MNALRKNQFNRHAIDYVTVFSLLFTFGKVIIFCGFGRYVQLYAMGVLADLPKASTLCHPEANQLKRHFRKCLKLFATSSEITIVIFHTHEIFDPDHSILSLRYASAVRGKRPMYAACITVGNAQTCEYRSLNIATTSKSPQFTGGAWHGQLIMEYCTVARYYIQ